MKGFKAILYNIAVFLVVFFHISAGIGFLFDIGFIKFDLNAWIGYDGKVMTEETFIGFAVLGSKIMGMWYSSTGIAMIYGNLVRSKQGVRGSMVAPLLYHVYCVVMFFQGEFDEIMNHEVFPPVAAGVLHMILGVLCIVIFLFSSVAEECGKKCKVGKCCKDEKEE